MKILGISISSSTQTSKMQPHYYFPPVHVFTCTAQGCATVSTNKLVTPAMHISVVVWVASLNILLIGARLTFVSEQSVLTIYSLSDVMLSQMNSTSWMDEVGRNAFNKPFFSPTFCEFYINSYIDFITTQHNTFLLPSIRH